jgi:hypothetical protein
VSRDIRRDLKAYGEFIDSRHAPFPPETIVESVAPLSRVGTNTANGDITRKTPMIALAIGAAVSLLLVAGPVLLLGRDDPQSSPASTVREEPNCQWASTTVTITEGAAVCPAPETAEERILAAAYATLGSERFAGLWYDADTNDLVLGYVGAAPDRALLPDIDEFIERDHSLADMEAEAAARNAEDGEDSGHWWMVDVSQGTVVSIDISEEYAGQSIRAREACSTAVARWSEAVANKSLPEYFAAAWQRGSIEVLYLECRDDVTGEWTEWHVLRNGVVPAEDDPNPPGSDL